MSAGVSRDARTSAAAARDGRGRIALFSSCLPGWSAERVLESASELGLGAVEWGVGPGQAIEDPDRAAQLAERCRAQGVRTVGVSVQDPAVRLTASIRTHVGACAARDHVGRRLRPAVRRTPPRRWSGRAAATTPAGARPARRAGRRRPRPGPRGDLARHARGESGARDGARRPPAGEARRRALRPREHGDRGRPRGRDRGLAARPPPRTRARQEHPLDARRRRPGSGAMRRWTAAVSAGRR